MAKRAKLLRTNGSIGGKALVLLAYGVYFEDEVLELTALFASFTLIFTPKAN
jgi:hypothetical protein